ncbi:MAG: type II secretion system protein [Candidatus Saccharimonadales bacterium]
MWNLNKNTINRNISKNAGFTIIELLVVLAIAGFILLVVLEAIPALSRSSRNTQRKHDVSVILGEISNYELRDSDNFPQTCGGAPNPDCFHPLIDAKTGKPSITYPNDFFLQYSASDLTYYKNTGNNNLAVQIIPDYPQNNISGGVLGNPNPNKNLDQVLIYDYEKCSSAGGGQTDNTGADYNNVVALFAIEGGNGTTKPQCQQL